VTVHEQLISATMLAHVKSTAVILGSTVSDCVPRRRPLGKTRGAPDENPRAAGRAICCGLRGALSAKYSAVGTRHDGGEQPLSERTTAVARHDKDDDGDDVDDDNSSNEKNDNGDNEYDDDVSARRRFNTRRRKTHRCKEEVMVAKEQEAA